MAPSALTSQDDGLSAPFFTSYNHPSKKREGMTARLVKPVAIQVPSRDDQMAKALTGSMASI
jgi:hypothetical protein